MTLRASYDVFISYSHHDFDWVSKTLVPTLENRGFSVCVDYRDFQGGAFSAEEMESAVANSRHTIIVLSPDYITSDWTKFENIMAQTLDPGAATRRLIPILLRDCTLPLRLRTMTYRDFRGGATPWTLLTQDLM